MPKSPPLPFPLPHDKSSERAFRRRAPSENHSMYGGRPDTRNGTMSPSEDLHLNRSKSPVSPTSPIPIRLHGNSMSSDTAGNGTSVKMVNSDMLDPPEALYGKSQNSSTTSLGNNPNLHDGHSVASSKNIHSPNHQSEITLTDPVPGSIPGSVGGGDDDPSGFGWRATRGTPGRTESDDGPGSKKKNNTNKRLQQLLSRTQSIRTTEPSTETPKSREKPRFTRHITPTSRERNIPEEPKTAPLESPPGFGEMAGSRPKRNQSAERVPGEKEEDLHKPHKGGPSNAFFSKIMSSSSKAADEMGAAGKGLWGRFHKEKAPPEKYTHLDTYHFQVINLPLMQQTRISRVAKSMGDAYDKTQYWMPSLPYRCIEYLNLHGAEEEGLYRLSGSAREIKRWQVKFDTGPNYDVQLLEQDDLYDINAISSMFKAWLRDLPDEILPKSVQDRVAEHCKGEQAPSTPQMFRDELSQLPPHNYYLLFAITCHISLLHSNREKNKMNYQNLCICFQPCMKMDALSFQFLVCDWRNCWQGCWTEQEYLGREQESLDAFPPGSGYSQGTGSTSTTNLGNELPRPGSTVGSRPTTGAATDAERQSSLVLRMKGKSKVKVSPSDVDSGEASSNSTFVDAHDELPKRTEASTPPPAPELAPVVPVSPMRGFA